MFKQRFLALTMLVIMALYSIPAFAQGTMKVKTDIDYPQAGDVYVITGSATTYSTSFSTIHTVTYSGFVPPGTPIVFQVNNVIACDDTTVAKYKGPRTAYADVWQIGAWTNVQYLIGSRAYPVGSYSELGSTYATFLGVSQGAYPYIHFTVRHN